MTTTHNSLVSGAALEEHLGAWAVVDCRFDLQRENWGLDQYLEAHVPSAVYASLSKDLSGRPDGSNGRHPLPSIDSIAETFGRLGIERSTQVVAYDQDAGMYASRLWWMLRYLGHQAVAVLDGGWARWTAEGRPTANGAERRSPARFVPQPCPEMLATAADVEAVLGQRSVVLVDARAPERFEGRSETIDRVAGHIPGAVNHFYKSNVTASGEMLPPADLRQRFERVLGSRTPDHAIMYCGSGVTACHNLLAMEHAGLPGARLFVGSWSEWSADPSRPVATGPEPGRP
ncbi:MAG TPA: sulfurtransferase [Vicinamibacterales bacterium]|nr:sulfurtransferase [Vicinamibacterales bacterium]